MLAGDWEYPPFSNNTDITIEGSLVKKILVGLPRPCRAMPSDVPQKPTCLSENAFEKYRTYQRMGGGNWSGYNGYEF
jgi:hypothetical protein